MNRKKNGKSKDGHQRYRCNDCDVRFTDDTMTLDGMRIGMGRAEFIIKLLCEGTSVRVASRLTDTKIEMILDLLVLIGERCKAFMEENIRNVLVDDVQCDEVWQFIYCKEKTRERKGFGMDRGDSYLFTAIERNTKLLICWQLGKRDPYNTEVFAHKLQRAVGSRKFHLSTDGYGPYRRALTNALAGRINYGQVVKVFGKTSVDDQRKYSPASISAIKKEMIWGTPNYSQTCTSHIERHNLTLRTFIRRMNRLTCAFSKKWENREAMVALAICHYNYCRKHGTIKTTPAVANGLASDVWTVRDLILNTSTS
jgi:IS1 family transposase/transposase-like protein